MAKDRRAVKEAWFESGYDVAGEIGWGIHPPDPSTRLTQALKSSEMRHIIVVLAHFGSRVDRFKQDRCI